MSFTITFAPNVLAVGGSAPVTLTLGEAQAAGWYTLRIGGGGYMTAMDRNIDTTTIHRTDTYGAYIWEVGEAEWVQLITYQTMPTWFQIPKPSFWNIVEGTYAHSGVYEIRIAPSDSNTSYMQFLGFMLKTTNLKATTVNAQGLIVSACTWQLTTQFFEATATQITGIGGSGSTNTITVGSSLPTSGSCIVPNNTNLIDLTAPSGIPYGVQISTFLGFVTATIGGTSFISGDTVSLTFTNAEISNFPVTFTYTLGSGESATSIAAGLVALITAFSNNTGGLMSASNVAGVITLQHSYANILHINETVASKTITGTGNETVTFSPSSGDFSATAININLGLGSSTVNVNDVIILPVLDGANVQAYANDRVNNPKMAIHPTNPDIVWTGTPFGSGLWKTTDGGSTWAQVSISEVPLATYATVFVGGGTFNSGDTVSLTITNPRISGLPVTVTYTFGSSENANTVAAGVAALINASSTLTAGGIYANVILNKIQIPIRAGYLVINATTMSAARSGTGDAFLSPANPLLSWDDYTGLWYDPSDATHQTIYLCSNGVGFFVTTDGGSTWTQISGAPTSSGPSTCADAKISSTGVLWVINKDNDGQGNGPSVWRYSGGGSGGTWSLPINSYPNVPVQTLAVDQNHVVVVGSIFNVQPGALIESTDGSTFPNGWNTSTNIMIDTSPIPWTGAGGQNTVDIGVDCAFFTGPGSNEFWASGNQGFWTCSFNSPVTSSSIATWTVMSQGQEQIVANCIIPIPGGGWCLGGWDFEAWFKPQGTFDDYALEHGPNPAGFSACWSLDWSANDPSFLVGIFDGAYINQHIENSSFTTDGGQTWTTIAVLPPGVPPAGAGEFESGWAGCVATASTTNWVWAACGAISPFYTTNGGASPTWSPCVFQGILPQTTISSGIYNTLTGLVTLTMAASVSANSGTPILLNNLTGIGNYGSLQGQFSIASASGTTVTFNGPTGLGSVTITGGDAHGFSNSFSQTYFDNAKQVCADRVLANTFYAVYIGQGLFTSTDGGATWTLTQAANPAGQFGMYFGPGHFGIWAVPGQASTLFMQYGNGNALAYSTGGGVTWTAVANVLCNAIGFGVAAPGKTWPSIYIVGLVNSVYGVFGCSDAGDNPSNSSLWTWTKFGDWPIGTLDAVTCVSGDLVTLNQIALGNSGSGWKYYHPG